MLTNEDFTLTESELAYINKRCEHYGAAFAAEGEQNDGVYIRFAFGPPFGRSIDMSYSGGPWEDVE